MANQEHLELITQGTSAWNQWRQQHKRGRPDLRDSNLHGLNLSGANLTQTDFNRSNLRNVNFSDADLRDADLGDADLMYADMTRTDLRNANLSGSDISGANLTLARLKGTEFTNGWVGATTFANTDLSSARGIDTLKHFAPSTIGVDTLSLSVGTLPEAFLRGCGMSDWQIEVAKLYNPTLSSEQLKGIFDRIEHVRSTCPIQQRNVFISYSHGDREFVDALERQLKSNHIVYWRDIHDAPAGPLGQILEQAMRRNPTVLLVLSHNSIHSDWVEFEAQSARELEKELDRHVLCPIALDHSWETSQWSPILRNQIRKYNVLDFSGWRSTQILQEQFDRLMRGLNLYYEPKTKGISVRTTHLTKIINLSNV